MPLRRRRRAFSRRPYGFRRRRVFFRGARRRFSSRRRSQGRGRFLRRRRYNNRPELKTYILPVTPVTWNNAFSYGALTASIPQGTTSQSRVGSSIVVRRLQFLFQAVPSATTTLQQEFIRPAIWRIVENVSNPTSFSQLYDTDLTGTVPQIIEYGRVMPGVRCYRPVWTRRYRLVKPGDSSATPATTRVCKSVDLRWRKGLRIQYFDPGAGDYDSRKSNQLIFFLLGEQAGGGNPPIGEWMARVWFTDV